ncbi:alanine racemase [Granulicatella sp. zg-ZJ]|uniref:alanine racemase n=1 Tax=unclassified Granulicatella TaxID=2630493 RepID=UPI0013BF1E5F|nr:MULTISPECIES: alanine racemase [unclassified Granulicatella]MBS4750119.1 alanine racemase [Carnobacteriaceae bacterium zg-ZUI78]NEW62128.1 alanine racemase [Granulicatella sp. zg-ZJ]NEW66829.1 alanine racemase [Granulicatella sp. zg-84]QMI86231.1 alanine racemase [Carnobacteriaceae bacterium zg-84]
MNPAIHRPATVTIHLDRLAFNIDMIKQHLTKDKAFFAVVKANAYGHGAIEIAKKAQACGVDGFCVAMLDEALELRHAGITKPILVLGLTQICDVPLAIEYDISLTVTSLIFLKEAQVHIKKGRLKVHLALNTGMNRLGLQTKEDVITFEQGVLEMKNIDFEGVFTHFATADGEDDNKVKQQCRLFETLLSVLTTRPKYIHLANSAMTLWRETVETDIVRVGIGMYGVNPSDFALKLPYPLKPVLTWETEISFVHRLKQGESVSYGAKYIAKQDEWIATLPIGYADGFRRALGTQSVYIGDEKCDVVGVVCMDQMMIRISQPYPIGTKVELIGEHNTASSLAVSIGTIGYEILCGISDRVPRIYVE